ncbi:MAG: hypothetical protein FWG74_05985 [Planctomycetes bacterium]|nr:hypothetical protein [Planctomycetota bacterium]
MRRMFIGMGLIVFAVYCWASVAYQSRVVIPDDKLGEAGLLAKGYLLRDSVSDYGNPVGPPLYAGGTPLNEEMLDDLRRRGLKHITITGHAPMVNFQFGTALMLVVIFLTLVAALKPILWDPFLTLLEKRRRELAMGNEAASLNQQEAIRYDEERRRRHSDLRLNIQELRMNSQRHTANQVGEILKAAKERGKSEKLAGLGELGEAIGEAEIELDRQTPEVMDAIVRILTPGRKEDEP